MKTFVTFGQGHAHTVNGQTFDKDCVAVIESPSPEEGRRLAFECFGSEFFTTYFEQPPEMHFFPRGFIPLNSQ